MSVEFYRESAGKFDSRTLSRKTLSRWTGRIGAPRIASGTTRPAGRTTEILQYTILYYTMLYDDRLYTYYTIL